MVCPNCGGSHFYVVRTEEFANAGYGSAQFRSVSINQEPAYLCLCGKLVVISETGGRAPAVGSARAKFLISMAKAAESREGQEEKQNSFVSRAVYEQLLERVIQLEADVSDLAVALYPETAQDVLDNQGETQVDSIPGEDNIEEVPADPIPALNEDPLPEDAEDEIPEMEEDDVPALEESEAETPVVVAAPVENKRTGRPRKLLQSAKVGQ
jgi:hypothetical protein